MTNEKQTAKENASVDVMRSMTVPARFVTANVKLTVATLTLALLISVKDNASRIKAPDENAAMGVVAR
jgi:hypothetical protein